jgi:BMFP domain-containing protein YqiC
MPDFIELLLSQSFPVAVAAYLLIRTETKLETLEQTIQSLNSTIKVLCYSQGVTDVDDPR